MEQQVLYACIARNSTILAEHSLVQGNFTVVARSILEKLSSDDDRRSLLYDPAHMFHYSIVDGICYMCLTDQSAVRRIPFAFLSDIQKRFSNEYGNRVHTAGQYAFNQDFSGTLAAQMEYFSNNVNADQINRMQLQVDEVKSVMVENINKLLARQEKLDILVEQASALKSDAASFKAGTNDLRIHFWRKNMKLTLMLIAVVLVVILIVAWLLCGFPLFGSCLSFLDSSESTDL
ncbi:Synaptobrevin [Carpediemonas membranifera]|uniref:Synaptobrevin n=1 Tax=Carpediemonas membranifera TaxID=201153 RepID=A0A8J6E1R2_9EUKA|nr:Synaptobrevin [Carpediemonas membranifera]|eukprot:KAG9393788.1 Synaptobrevin [Carpediemonas membranifera]